MKSEIQEQLHTLAIKRSIPFCYSCYQKAPSGSCETCGSDDLMRITEDGCEYGTEWIIKSILEIELTPVCLDAEFEEFVSQCYPDNVQVGWMTLDAVSVMKSQDPTSWSIARSEWESQESDEGTIVSFDGGSNYYRTSEVEDFICTQ